ncbi:NAD-glutamate dehydrogenase [Paraconexibacter algicola]|uniref:NAD-glutamate dehydrogenase n=1 Tax=Paraconexibacter algicola TaxID=2133960 RepID=A0A2T4UDQ6_9ACTN|nr:NAD-glutamate dehydrogenase domain-containing protein [Paraconexibacter algicola]PTL55633.1 NAD-glutamate dehydrogenase [Paraconexibacter algicola]
MEETVTAALGSEASQHGIDADALRAFAERYLRRRATEPQDAAAVAAEVRGAFLLADGRGTAPSAVRAHTPSVSQDGYEATGSVLETNTDDLPFLVDSVVAEIEAQGVPVRSTSHPILGVRRDAEGRIVAVGAPGEDLHAESVIHVAMDRRLTPEELARLEDGVADVLAAVARAVSDFPAMCDSLLTAADELQAGGDPDDAEAAEFLRWVADEHFVLIGHRGTETAPLGLLAEDAPRRVALDAAPADGNGAVTVRKGADRSPVHRRVRLDELHVRDAGVFVGLFTSRADAEPAGRVPLLRHKLRRILAAEDLAEGSHDWKAAVALYESFPKDLLFGSSTEALRGLVVELLGLAPSAVRVLGRRETDRRHAALLAVVPRASYDAGVRDDVRELVRGVLRADEVAVDEVLGEGDHVRLHVGAYAAGGLPELDLAELERGVAALSRTWDDRLRDVLVTAHGDERGRLLHARWAGRLPSSYKARTEPQAAVADVDALEDLRRRSADLAVHLRTEAGIGNDPTLTRLTVVRRGDKAELSAVMPVLEHLGLRVVEERPTRLVHDEEAWLQDFGVLGPDDRPLDLERCGERVAACVRAVLRGEAESDDLHRLVVLTDLSHDRLEALRAYRRYRQRIGSRFTEAYQNEVIAQNAQLTQRLVELFELRFDPSREPDPEAERALRAEIDERLDAVVSLDHDRILRNQLGVIDATLRTNAYVPGRGALAFKLRSADVPALPSPPPLVEIFVCGDEVEGIHIRGGRIARGGLRWSDRQDYRTEVWGLMRAQMVKNAVIVPTGAKGGFYLRRPPADPASLREAVRRGYETYINALLDLSDDRDGDRVVPPAHVRRYDDDDPYLVVAADKGTATFSDVANGIAQGRGFWLDDAFASGGSAGYDHKALGITARGAWESVKRHFRELGVDPERDPVTVVGIGDMSGDVFGNGMLLSRSLRLVAAYDHRHVFLDPDPGDPAAAWAERRRLFDRPGSTWDDYDRELISPGGGVFPRTAKRIPLSDEIRRALAIDDVELAPADLIRAVLRAPVDLLFNGGIGTVVKASTESDADAQDRSSDAIRVDARDLRVRVVGEGGNLGFTQRARVEAARSGILVNADFIDNSAGVDCSDHEVNLKILLGLLEQDPQDGMTRPERDALLADVTGDVTAHVLQNSFLQAQIITQEERRSAEELLAYEDLMLDLERGGMLDRALERLPSSEELAERRSAGQGLLRPEIAVLLALAKQQLADTLLADGLLDDPALREDLRGAFPPRVLDRVGDRVDAHPLRREIVATRVANDVIDAHGPTFVARRVTELGVPAADVVRAQRIARDGLGAVALWERVERLHDLSPADQWSAMTLVDEAVRISSRWVLRHAPGAEIGPLAAATAQAAELVRADVAGILGGDRAAAHERRATALAERGVPQDLATALALLPELVHAPALVGLAQRTGRDVPAAAAGLVAVQDALWLSALHTAVAQLPPSGRAQRWAALSVTDELHDLAVELAGVALSEHPELEPAAAVGAALATRAVQVERFTTLARMVAGEGADVAGLGLVARRLRTVVGR